MTAPLLRLALPVLVALAAAGALALLLPGVSPAATDAEKLQKLERKIGGARGKAADRRKREGVLTSDVRRLTTRIGSLRGRIGGLQARQDTVQADLDRSRALLTSARNDLRSERARLVRLRARLAEARRVLAARLVELYQTEKPDLVGVVLNSRGFSDLVERAGFLERIGEQDRKVMVAVRDARADAIRTEERLSDLEASRSETTARIDARRDEIASVKGRLVSIRNDVAASRDNRSELLRGVRSDRRAIEEDLEAMEKQQATIRSKLSGMPSGGVKRGSGQLDYPADGQFTSPFGTRWGRLHAGIDIAVPTGTAVHASDSGTVRIAGFTGGYGNYICIDHGGGLSTCYAHNSRLGVTVGQKVTKGQVIAASGNTGNSTGPHIHFETRVGGVPRDPMGYL